MWPSVTDVSAESHQTDGIGRSPRRREEVRRSRKAAVSVAQMIVDDVTAGRVAPGTMLASEREMIERFGVARGTLREALRFLEMNGVITVKAGPAGGTVTVEPDARDFAGVLGLFLQRREMPFRTLVQAREVLEPELAGLAAGNGSDETIATIVDSVDGMEAFLEDEENFLAENHRFHHAVAAAAGNRLLEQLISALHIITEGQIRGIAYRTDHRREVAQAHRSVADAIAARDAEGARWAMRQHVRDLRRYLESDYPAVLDRPLRWRDITA